MPRRKSSVKKSRADRKKHQRNLKVKTKLKKILKKIQTMISAKKIEEARSSLQKVFSELDKAAKKNIIHPKTANRRKSRLAKRLSKTA